MGRGGCKDYADYKFNVGQIRAYRQTEDFVSDVFVRINEGEDI
jgi:hypothetical protein